MRDMEYDPAMDLLKAMDEQVNVIEDADASIGAREKKAEMELGTAKPKTNSAKMLREMEGSPAGSPVNDALMLDVAAWGAARRRRPHLPRKIRVRRIFRERLRCRICWRSWRRRRRSMRRRRAN